MYKASYNDENIIDWMNLNKVSAEKFAKHNNEKFNYPLGVQIVIDKEILEREVFLSNIRKYYSNLFHILFYQLREQSK